MLAARQPRSAPVGRRKLLKNFRLTPHADAMLDELATLHGRTRTEMVEQAIREKYRRDTGRVAPQERPDSGTNSA